MGRDASTRRSDHDRLKDRYGIQTKLMLFSQVEYLTFILAHEARHLWQDRVSSRPWTPGPSTTPMMPGCGP